MALRAIGAFCCAKCTHACKYFAEHFCVHFASKMYKQNVSKIQHDCGGARMYFYNTIKMY